MASTPIGRLHAKLLLDSKQFRKEFASAEKVVKDVSKKMQHAGRELSKYVTVPLTAIGGAVVKMGKDFEHEMVKIETLVGVNRTTVSRWGKELKALASEVGRGPSELARALFVVTSAGERTETALEIVEQAAKASAIGLGDTAEVARAATGAMKAFQLQGLGASQAVDILTATVREGNLQAEDLAGVIGRVNGMAATLGITFAEVGGAIASYTRLGIKAEEATVGLRAVLSSLTKPTKESEDALLSIGLSTEELLRMIREDGLAASLNYLVEQFDGNAVAISKVIPNVRALAFLMGTAAANGREFVDVTKSVNDSLGIVDTGFGRVKETATAAFDEMKASLESLAVSVSEEGGLLDLFKLIADDVKHFSEVVAKLPPDMKMLVTRVAALAAALGPLTIAVAALTPAIVALGFALVGLLPYVGTIALITLMLGVKNLPQIINAWDTITSKIDAFRESFKRAEEEVKFDNLSKNPTLQALAQRNLEKLGILKPTPVVKSDKNLDTVLNQYQKRLALIREETEKLNKEMSKLRDMSTLIGDEIDLSEGEMGLLQEAMESLLDKGIKPTDEELRKLAARWIKLNEELEKKEAIEGIDEIFAQLQKTLRGMKLQGVTADLYDQQQALLEYAAAANLSTDEINKLMDQLDSLYEEMELAQNQVEIQKNLEQPFKNAAENIQREWGNLFTDLIRNGTSAFDDFGEFLLDLFSRLAGEIITLLIFEPQALTTGGPGGGGILGGISGWFGGLGRLGGLFGGGYGSYQANAPYSVPVPPDSNWLTGIMVGSMDMGKVWDVAGSAVQGMLTSIAVAELFKFGTGGKHGIGQKIGGYVGTVIGGILGAYLGKQAGGTIGSIVGNWLIGSMGWGIQNVVETGNIFTPQMSRSQQAQVGGVLPGWGPAMSDLPTWKKAGLVQLEMWDPVMARILPLLGLYDPGKPTMKIVTTMEKLENRLYESGRYVETPFGFTGLSAADTEGMGKGFTESYLELIENIDNTLAKFMTDESLTYARAALDAAEHVREKSRDMDDEIFLAVKEHIAIILNSLTGEAVVKEGFRYTNELLDSMLREAKVGNNYEKLVQFATEIVAKWYEVSKAIDDTIMAYTVGIPEAKSSIESLNDTFDDLVAAAVELGMAEQEIARIEQGRADSLAAMTSKFEHEVQKGIWAFTDPFRGAMDELLSEQQERLRNAEILGADLVEVERLNALERVELMKVATQELDTYLRGLRTPYAVPAEQVVSARQEFFALASRVSAGEYVDPGKLVEIASAFEQASRNVYASSPQFFEDLSLIEEILEAALARYDIIAEQSDFSNVSSIDSAREEQTALLSGIDNGVQELMESQAALITNLTNEVTSLRTTIEEQQAEIVRLARAVAA